MSPSPLYTITLIHLRPMDKVIFLKEISSIIDKELPSHLRSDYLRIMSGISINKKRRLEIMETVYKILTENGYDETWQDI